MSAVVILGCLLSYLWPVRHRVRSSEFVKAVPCHPSSPPVAVENVTGSVSMSSDVVLWLALH